jgi:hypothetical protein
MQKTKINYFIILCIVFIFNSCIKTKAISNETIQLNTPDASSLNISNDIQNLNETISVSIPLPITLEITNEMLKLNGTWLPHWAYMGTMNLPEEERYDVKKLFSWGEGKRVVHTTFEIDITADIPFFDAGGDGRFYVTGLVKDGENSIKILAETPEFHWKKEPIFHFIDNDIFWIENEEFGKSFFIYGDDALWHRLSGPAQ